MFFVILNRRSLDGSGTVDHRIARGRSVFRLDVARMPSVQSISRSLLFDESDDEAADEGGDWQPVSRRNVTGDSKGLAAPGYTQVSERTRPCFRKIRHAFRVF